MSVMQDFERLSGYVLVDGAFRRSFASNGRDVIDPATENVISEKKVDEAIASAESAQRTWWKKSALKRAEAMHEIANDLLAMKAQLAEALTREMGKPYKESADDVDWSVSAIRYYAEIGRSDMGRVMSPAVEGHLNYTLKLPVGVVVSIQPFNYPMTLLA